MTARKSITIKTPAKINWSLEILGKRPDGYHEIDTVMQAISLYDTLTITEIDKPRCVIECNDPNVPTDERNLVTQAWLHYRKVLRDRVSGVRVRLDKQIPCGAGLGGGSSDCAAMLYGLARLFEPRFRRDTLCRMAARFGSDVPFFVWGGAAHVTGRGEFVERLQSRLPPIHLVVCYPGFPSPTAAAYAKLKAPPYDEAKRPEVNATILIADAVEDGLAAEIQGLQVNAFDPFLTKLEPRYEALKRAMQSCGLTSPMLSGSGSACFAWAIGRKHALAARNTLADAYPQTFAVRTIKEGPVILPRKLLPG